MLASEHADTLYRVWRHRRTDPEALRQFQVRKLRVLLAHCRARVAVYREHWSTSDLVPSDVATPRDIEALPTIGKNDLRSRPVREALAEGVDVRRLVHHTTSGSSGQPFTIYRLPREEHLLGLFRWRASAEAGVRAFDRIARFSQLPLDEVRRGWPGRIRQALGIRREQQYDGLAPAQAMLENLQRYRPDVVCGYPSTLRHVAASAPRSALWRAQPRLVLSGGEVLDAASRRTIEQAFGAPLVDFYGAHEFNLLASQCPEEDAYHVCDDNVIVEILGDDGKAVQPGEVGEVVATALHSYTQPFVRYRTGDLAVRGQEVCRCGRPFSTLRAVQGRAADYLRLPGGRCVHPYAITGHLAEREAEWVAQHQIVQTGVGRIQLNIQPRRPPQSEDLGRLRRWAGGILGADVEFDLSIVDSFPPHRSGKFRPYLSLIQEAVR
jgi:phenylacetate-CoA ligase